MKRTHTCGELRREDESKEVVLTGWVSRVRNLGHLVFVDLRDRYGLIQLNIDPALFEKQPLKSEYCVEVSGTVALKEEPNPDLATGEIEVKVSSYKVFSKSALPPFIIADRTDANEDTRLKSRYLDLRRGVLQRNLTVRHALLKAARTFLEERDFLEIETPTLVRSTPEGARDYLVPSRTKPGNFYALPQSPQIYKQLLMIGGFDRYYQVARCYRDEDLRADRQPEFTQIDVEMSFADREDVLAVIEGLIRTVFRQTIGVDLPEFVRLSYREAIELYGSDKPDLRFGMQLNDVSAVLAGTGFAAYEGKTVKALVVPKAAAASTRKTLERDNETVRKYGLHSVFHFKVTDGTAAGSAAKFFDPAALLKLVSAVKAEEGDLIVVGAHENYGTAAVALGAIRSFYARELGLCDKGVYAPCFVLDWPLFGQDGARVVSLSNPFTRPRDEDLPYLESDPTRVLSYAYDTVINGVELSSGALRIYDGEVQRRVFALLGLTEAEIREKFGFFVDAFAYGTPPHGGFAIGVDRLAMVLCGTDNVRDVVAFPKNLQAVCPMCEAPNTVPSEALKILGLKSGEPDNG